MQTSRRNPVLRRALGGIALMALAAVTLSGLLQRPAFAGDDPQYVGSKKCKMCHLKEFKSWETTKMAHSMESLKPGQDVEIKTKSGLDPQKDYSQDPACIKCHTTGFGQPGGYAAGTATAATMENNQCESCHGPGSQYEVIMKDKAYKQADAIAAGMVVPDEKNCVTCHNDESPTREKGSKFDYEASKGKSHEIFPMKNPH